MMKMSWTHYSKTVAVGVLLAVALGAAGTAAAVTFQDESAPESAAVGEEVTIEVTMDELYANNLPDNWTLRANTSLKNADFTLVVKDAAGEEVARVDEASQEITQQLSVDQNHVKAELTVTGTVPEMDGFNYQNKEEESVTGLLLSQQVEGGSSKIEGGEWTIHKYTDESQNAREKIDEAQSAVEGVDNEDAANRLDEAITFYNNGEFENAINAAEEAQSTAEGASGGSTPVVLIVGGVVVVGVVLGGGVWYWRKQQQPSSKLQ